MQHQQNTTVITTAPMQPTTALVQRQHNVNTRGLKGLGITNIVLGIISLGIGIATTANFNNYWVSSISAGIWGGVWFVIAGILAVSAAANPNNTCLIGTTMAFNIISTILAFSDGIVFLIGLIYATNCNYNYYYYYNYDYYYGRGTTYGVGCGIDQGLGTALFSIQMILMIAEFFVALITAIYCCSGCCGTRSAQGVVIHQQPQYQAVTSTTGQPVGYPPVVSQGYPVSQGYHAQPQLYQQQPVYTSQGPMQQAGATNVAYSGQEQICKKTSLLQNEPTAPGFNQGSPPPYIQH